jgi:signal peptidase II
VPEHVPHEFFGDALRFTLSHNQGAAMNLSAGRYSRVVFSVAAVLAIAIVWRMYAATAPGSKLRSAALALVLGGAIGNLANRIVSARGVTDFIDVGVGTWRFWTFNVADAALTMGAGLLVLVLSRERRHPSQATG